MRTQDNKPKPLPTPAPALDDNREISLDEWDDIVADHYKVPRSLFKAVTVQESGGNVNAVSPTGVKGRQQVTRKVAQQYGLNRDNPWEQSVAAARYLREQYDGIKDTQDDDERWLGAVGRYYGGPGAVKGGEISGRSIDGLSNPAEHVSRIAQKWGELRKQEQDYYGQQSATLQPTEKEAKKQRIEETRQQADRVQMQPGETMDLATGEVKKTPLPSTRLQTPTRGEAIARLPRGKYQGVSDVPVNKENPFEFRGNQFANLPEPSILQPGTTVKVEAGQPSPMLPRRAITPRERQQQAEQFYQEGVRQKAARIDRGAPLLGKLKGVPPTTAAQPVARTLQTPQERQKAAESFYQDQKQQQEVQRLQSEEAKAKIRQSPAGVAAKYALPVYSAIFGDDVVADFINQTAQSGIESAGDVARGIPLTGASGAYENLAFQAVDRDVKQLESWAKDRFPTDPTASGFFRRTVPQGLGSAAAFMAGGLLSRGGSMLASAQMGAAMNAAQSYDEARAAGMDEGRATAAASIGGLIGSLEALGMGRAIDKMGLRRDLAKRAMDIYEETGQEGLSQALNNVNAAVLSAYDPNRPLDEGVIESALAGALTSVGMQIPGIAASYSNRPSRLPRGVNADIQAIRNEQPAPLAGVQPRTGVPFTPTAIGPTGITNLQQALQRPDVQQAVGITPAQQQPTQRMPSLPPLTPRETQVETLTPELMEQAQVVAERRAYLDEIAAKVPAYLSDMERLQAMYADMPDDQATEAAYNKAWQQIQQKHGLTPEDAQLAADWRLTRGMDAQPEVAPEAVQNVAAQPVPEVTAPLTEPLTGEQAVQPDAEPTNPIAPQQPLSAGEQRRQIKNANIIGARQDAEAARVRAEQLAAEGRITEAIQAYTEEADALRGLRSQIPPKRRGDRVQRRDAGTRLTEIQNTVAELKKQARAAQVAAQRAQRQAGRQPQQVQSPVAVNQIDENAPTADFGNTERLEIGDSVLPSQPVASQRIANQRQQSTELPLQAEPTIFDPRLAQEPTNRITEGAGDEMPRRVSRPLEGQPVEQRRTPSAPSTPVRPGQRVGIPRAPRQSRTTEYEGGEMQRYSRPLEGQPAETATPENRQPAPQRFTDEGDGKWRVTDDLGGEAYGQIKDGEASITEMQSVPRSKKFGPEEGRFKRRGFFRGLINTLRENGARTIRINRQSADTKKAVARLIETGELTNPRGVVGSSGNEHPTVFDIAGAGEQVEIRRPSGVEAFDDELADIHAGLAETKREALKGDPENVRKGDRLDQLIEKEGRAHEVTLSDYRWWTRRNGIPSHRIDQIANPAHRSAVEQALADGRTVPPEVLADYPDLQPAQPSADARAQRLADRQQQQIERREQERKASRKGVFGKFSEKARKTNAERSRPALVEHPELRELLNLPEMPPYYLDNGKVNPEWNKAAQDTLNALAEMGGVARSSELDVPMLRGVYRRLQLAAQRKGTTISDSLKQTFRETVADAMEAQENYQRFITDDRIINILRSLDNAAYERRSDKREQAQLKAAARAIARERGLTDHFIDGSKDSPGWFKLAQAEAGSRAESRRNRESAQDRESGNRRDGEGVVSVEERATGTLGKPAEKPAERPAQTEGPRVAAPVQEPAVRTQAERTTGITKDRVTRETPAQKESAPIPLFSESERKAVSRTDLEVTLRGMGIKPDERKKLLDFRKSFEFDYKVKRAHGDNLTGRDSSGRRGNAYSVKDANAIIEEAYRRLHGEDALNRAKEIWRGQEQSILDSRVTNSPEYKALQEWGFVPESDIEKFRADAKRAGWSDDRIQQAIDEHADRWRQTYTDEGVLDYHRKSLAKLEDELRETEGGARISVERMIAERKERIDEILKAREADRKTATGSTQITGAISQPTQTQPEAPKQADTAPTPGSERKPQQYDINALAQAALKNQVTRTEYARQLPEDVWKQVEQRIAEIETERADKSLDDGPAMRRAKRLGIKVGDVITLADSPDYRATVLDILSGYWSLDVEGERIYLADRDLTKMRKVEETPQAVETEKAAEPAKPAAVTKPYKATVDDHGAFFDRVEKGDVTAAEFKAAFEDVIANEDAIKAELSKLTKDGIFEKFPGLRWRYKNEKKADVVDAAFREMQSDFTLGRSFSYGMTDGSYAQGIRNVVAKTTDESLKEYAERIKQNQAEREEKRKAALEGMEDPKTLDDYARLLKSKMADGANYLQARLSLTPEQRAKFDELAGARSRDERRARADQQKTEVRAAGQSMTGQVIETKHTRTGEPLFVVKAAERVEREIYNQWNATAKRLGGWYSSFRGAGAVPGFQFRTRENADAFLAYLGGNVEQAKDAVQTRRDAMQDDKSQTAVERLREMADSLDERADVSLAADRKVNTERRARFAASAEAAANADKAMAATMRNIADAIESGKAKFLDRVRQKVQVEMLQAFAHSGYGDYLRDKYPSYAEQEKHRTASPPVEAADYVQFPDYTAYRSDLAKLGRQLSENEGTKKLGAAILKVADDVTDAYIKFAKENLHKVSTFSRKDGTRATFANKAQAEEAIARSGYKGQAIVLPFKRGENIIILSPSAAREKGVWEGDNDARITLSPEIGNELVEKLKARRRSGFDIPWTFESAHERRKRLAAMGIETPAELRAAIREFIGLREQAKAPDKIKEMERAMIGRRNDGLDFFPTPAGTADAMIEAADIQEGMSVLEPSAGMGHIADRIREAGFEPDVVEMASDRRELLEAKGYNIAGSDFTEMSPRESSGYDRIVMNPPFSDRRDVEHVRHAYKLLKPGGRLVAIMGEGSFFGSDKKATEFREWLESVGGTSEKLEEGTFLNSSLPVNTGVNARMVVIDKPAVPVVEPEPQAQQPTSQRTPAVATPEMEGAKPAQKAEAEKPTARPETYWKGDRAEYTGNTDTAGGHTLHELEIMEGARKGETAWTSETPEGYNPNAERARREWREQQEGFRRLRDAEQKATSKPEKVVKSSDEPTQTTTTAASRGSLLEPSNAGVKAALGDQTSLKIPRSDKEYTVRYEVRELSDIQPSHDPQTFQKNPKYNLVNDRDYTSPANRFDVEEATKTGKFEPRLVLSDDPTATNGPPVIIESGDVLGGNSRTMMLGRIYGNHPQDAQKYRDALKKRAGMFGLDPAELDGFTQPVLVRVIEGTPENLQKLITDLNVQPGKAMSATETATARAKQLSPATMQFLADKLAAEGPDGTLAQALEGVKGVRILNRLIEDGVIPKGERNRYISDQSNLTPAAKQEIETMLLGRLFRDSDQMKRTAPEMRNKLARIAPHLAKTAGTEWDISNLIPNALEAANTSKNQKIELEMLNQRGYLFGEGVQYSPEELAIATLLKDSGPRQIENVFRRYAAEFEQSQQGRGLFGEPASQKEAFDEVFQSDRSEAQTEQPPSLFSDAPPRVVKEAQQRLKDAASGKLAGSGGQQLADLALVTGWKVYKAGMNFTEWARAVIKEAGAKVRPHLRAAWDAIQASTKDQAGDASTALRQRIPVQWLNPDEHTPKAVASKARSRYRPSKSHDGVVGVNIWALGLLDTAYRSEFKQPLDTNANISPKEARAIAARIRDRSEASTFEGEGRQNMIQLARSLDAAASAHAGVSIVLMKGENGIAAGRRGLRHEVFHGGQRAIDPDVVQLTDPKWLDTQPRAKEIRAELKRLGYEDDIHSVEAPAFVAAGDWARFGMSADDAAQFLGSYFDHIASRYGRKAVQNFRALHPALRKEKQRYEQTESGDRRGRSVSGPGRSDGRTAQETDAGGSRGRGAAIGAGTGGTSLFGREVAGVREGEGAGERSRRTRADVENSPEFKRWFGDSVVTENGKPGGKPLVVYHGTDADFDVFDLDKVQRPGYGYGFHFAESPSLASAYSKQGYGEHHNVVPAYLQITNPFTGDYYKFAAGINSNSAKQTVAALKSLGYDGIRYDHGEWLESKGTSPYAWVAFYPEQIKSATGNSGAFDPTNPSILRARENPPSGSAGQPARAAIPGARQVKQRPQATIPGARSGSGQGSTASGQQGQSGTPSRQTQQPQTAEEYLRQYQEKRQQGRPQTDAAKKAEKTAKSILRNLAKKMERRSVPQAHRDAIVRAAGELLNAAQSGNAARIKAAQDNLTKANTMAKAEPSGRDVRWYDYVRSPLSNLNYKGTYERILGDRGREISEAFRSAQVAIARDETKRTEVVKSLRQQLKPYQEQFRDEGLYGMANWLDEHVNGLQDPDSAFRGLAGFLKSFHYFTKLRWNPRSIAINLLQPFQTLWPHLTTSEYIKITKQALSMSADERHRVADLASRESGGKVEGIDDKPATWYGNPFSKVSVFNRVVGHLAGEMMADRLNLTGDAKVRMAADWAKKVEFDNSRWDVPPLFRGRVASVVGQFKPFTIKNLERLHADWKEAPQGSSSGDFARRSKMIIAQLTIGGTRSVLLPPLKSVLGVLILGGLAKALSKAGMDDDDAEKYAEYVYFGAPGLIEQDLSSSVTLLDEPFGNTPSEKAVNFLGGPTLSLIVKAAIEGEKFATAKDSEEQTASEKRKAAALRLAKAITPAVKTGQAIYGLTQGERPTMKMGGKEEKMTIPEAIGFGLMGTPLRQTKYYEEKDAYDWQNRLLGKPTGKAETPAASSTGTSKRQTRRRSVRSR